MPINPLRLHTVRFSSPLFNLPRRRLLPRLLKRSPLPLPLTSSSSSPPPSSCPPTKRPLTTFAPLKMRIPYVSDPPPSSFTESDLAIVERVRQRRAPRPLQPLDLALLQSPAVADGWNSFLGAIRTRTDALDAGLREIAISRVAVVNRAWYEWMHHAPLAIQAGVPREFMEGFVKDRADLTTVTDEEKKELAAREGSGGVGDKAWAVLRYTDEMTRNVHVPDDVFDEVKRLCGDKEVVELTAVIACYNCVSRFLVALDDDKC